MKKIALYNNAIEEAVSPGAPDTNPRAPDTNPCLVKNFSNWSSLGSYMVAWELKTESLEPYQ